jgi:hypothetical protein
MFKKLISISTATLLFVTGLSIFAAAPASANNIADNSTVSLVSMSATMSGGGTCSTRTAITSSTRVRTTTDGSNGEFTAAATSTFVWASTHQTMYDTIAARPATTRTTFTPVTGTSYTIYELKEGSTTAYYFCHGGQVDLLINGTDAITGWVIGGNLYFTSGESSGSGQSPASAEAARQAAIAAAKVELFSLLKSGKIGTLNQYLAADLYVINEKTAERVNAAVLKLAVADRENIDKVKSVIKVENFIEQVSTATLQKSITALQVVELKLIPADSRNKASVTSAIEKAPAGTLTSLASVQAVVDAHLASIKARKDRTAAIKAKIAAGNK